MFCAASSKVHCTKVVAVVSIHYFVPNVSFSRSFLPQVEEEPETRGGRRRTWDDEHVLKRQFSALVPAFDPRPGRTNIAQTQDIVIPSPGKVLKTQYVFHITLRKTYKY